MFHAFSLSVSVSLLYSPNDHTNVDADGYVTFFRFSSFPLSDFFFPPSFLYFFFLPFLFSCCFLSDFFLPSLFGDADGYVDDSRPCGCARAWRQPTQRWVWFRRWWGTTRRRWCLCTRLSPCTATTPPPPPCSTPSWSSSWLRHRRSRVGVEGAGGANGSRDNVYDDGSNVDGNMT